VRRKKEREIIETFLPSEVYNAHPKSNKPVKQNYRIVCKINGIQYNSVAEASRETQESETQIRNKLQNNFPGYDMIEQVKHGYQPIVANGKPYASINAAVAAGEATNRLQAMRRLKNPNNRNWYYQNSDKQVQKNF
jgi:hypothetical protein